MGQARLPAGVASAPHQPWQILMQTGQLGPGGLPSQQGGPLPGTVMYSAPPGGPQQPPTSMGQSPVNIRLSNYSGEPLPSLLSQFSQFVRSTPQCFPLTPWVSPVVVSILAGCPCGGRCAGAGCQRCVG